MLLLLHPHIHYVTLPTLGRTQRTYDFLFQFCDRYVACMHKQPSLVEFHQMLCQNSKSSEHKSPIHQPYFLD